MVLTFELDLDKVNIGVPARQISRSKVISFEKYCPHTETLVKSCVVRKQWAKMC